MKKQLDFILTNFHKLTPSGLDYLKAQIMDGLHGYPSLDENIIDDNLSQKKLDWIELQAERLGYEPKTNN